MYFTRYLLLALHLPIYVLAMMSASALLVNIVRSQVQEITKSACHVPIIKPICFFIAWRPVITPFPDITAALDSEFEGLDRLLRATADSSPQISRDLAHARIAVDDLIVVVKAGGLRCRDQLVEQLKIFGTDARRVAHDLNRFMWRVSSSVTRVQTANEQAISMLEEENARPMAVRALCKLTGNRLWLEPCQRSRELQLLFNMTLHAFESAVTSLMDMSGDLDVAFIGLDARLDAIRDIAADEGQVVLAEKDEVLADIWTALGGNRKTWARLRTQAHALHLVIGHHATAHRYVSLAHDELVVMDLALEDLRSTTVEAIWNQGTYSIDTLIETLSRGVDRLKQGRGEDVEHPVLDGMIGGTKSADVFRIR